MVELFPRHRWTVLCAVLALLVTGTAQAKRRPRLGHVQGTITAVAPDADPPTVTITRTGDGGGAVTLKVTSATRIEVTDEGRGSFADLRVGLAADARYNPDNLNAVHIEVAADPNNAEATGKVLSADADQVTLDTTGDDKTDLTLTLDAQTRVKLGNLLLEGKEIALLDGFTVRAVYDKTNFLAHEITARPDETAQIEGEVTAVNATAGTLTVKTESDTVTLVVPAGAEVTLLGRTAALGDVLVGDTVTVAYVTNGAGKNVALRVRIETPTHRVAGTLTSVAGNTLTIAPRAGGDPVSLTVNDQTKIRLRGRRSSLSGLAAALQSGRTVRVTARYFTRAGSTTVLDVQATFTGRGNGGGGHH
jgi:uncharacterized cupredoxin-like copper-binding protein